MTTKWTKESYFKSPKDNIKIHYATLEHETPSKHCIVFLPGWKEAYLKYYENCKFFYDNDIDVYTMDHRCQGFSEDTPGTWYLKGNKDGSGARVSHVDDFDSTYVEDARYFIENVVKTKERSSAKICVVAHSMGGIISIRMAQLHPGLFDNIATEGPMILHKNVLDLGGCLDIELPLWLSWIVGRIITALGLGRVKADGRDTDSQRPTTELLSHSKHRLGIWHQIRKDYPKVVLGGCSFGWVFAAIQCEQRAMQDVNKLTVPTLIFQADDDSFVYNSAMTDFGKKNEKKVVRVVGPIRGAYHEISEETDDIRLPYLETVMKFAKNENYDDALGKIPVQKEKSGAVEVRWKSGYHSGSSPPKVLPVPLIFRDKPQARTVVGAIVTGSIVAVAAKVFLSRF